ncbi:MAG: hypothetical protein V7774_09055 [Pseudorhizobium pelagicum]|uniref:hypothetical protein n=1 Tax=Pseudorhizobium pelagicum TaxID=1509405 RepID=UPI00345F9EE8
MIRYAPAPITSTPSQTARCARSLTERMAEDLREEAFSGRGDVQSLQNRGWSQASIERLGPAAIQLARRNSTRQVAR